MKTILDQLNKDHGNVARLLDILEDQLVLLRRGGPFDTTLLKSIMRYLTRYQDVFHHPREDLLFAKIALRSAGSVTDVQALEAEHVVLGSRGAALYRGLVGFSRDAYEPRDLEAQLVEYVDMLRTHMTKESSHVFPLAKVILIKHDWQDIDAALEVQTDPLFGPAVESAYRIVLERLGSERAAGGRH